MNLRRLTSATPACRISRAIRFRPTRMPSAASSARTASNPIAAVVPCSAGCWHVADAAGGCVSSTPDDQTSPSTGATAAKRGLRVDALFAPEHMRAVAPMAVEAAQLAEQRKAATETHPAAVASRSAPGHSCPRPKSSAVYALGAKHFRELLAAAGVLPGRHSQPRGELSA